MEEPISLANGAKLPGVRLAYESWGELSEDGSNAVLIFHALSGAHHVAGLSAGVELPGDLWKEELNTGWWDEFVGPGKAIDTEKFFVICFNYLGGCYGSTGPNLTDARTGRPYGASFPQVNVADQAEMAVLLMDHFGIEKWHAVVGPSVGGLCALTFATNFPERVERVVSVASGFKTTVLNRLILFEQILAIENDPHFNGGDYYEGARPDYGLALARMISHKTFVHLDAFEKRARRDVVQQSDSLSWYQVQDQFQSYMLHQGQKFVQRFDANTYLRIIDMWSRYDAVQEGRAESEEALLKRCAEAGQRFLVFSIDSDFCFYPEEQEELVNHLEKAEVKTIHITVHSDKGHDSFLLDSELYVPHLKQMMES